jgi:thiamine biosynthesis lipoprotein
MQFYNFDFIAMASPCSLTCYCTDALVAQIAADAARDEVLRIERKYSRYLTDSVLSQINLVAQSGGSIDLDSETSGIISFAIQAYVQSEGLFDISSGILRQVWDFNSGVIPDQASIDALLDRIGLSRVYWKAPCLTFTREGMELDLGGLGKEYAADRAAEVLSSYGIENALVDLGGDMVARGGHPDGEPWRIGIRNPKAPIEAITAIPLRDRALATSGAYERFITADGRRYGHILNPKTGWPCYGMASVTVAADTCLVAGCVSTTAMLFGPECSNYLKRTNLDYLYVSDDGALGGNIVSRSKLLRVDSAQ